MPLIPDARLGPYVILSQIGAGGMGEVYRARDTQLGRDVAIKVLPAYLSNDPDRLRRFEQEARAAAALNHPNILAVYQMGTFEGSPYLVSELLEGSTLRELMKGGPLASRKAIDYGAQIAHGLAAAHEKGIVHRDLKPENLFVTKDGRAKILDFGLAKLMQRQPTDETAPTMAAATDDGVVMGTVGYMSPEQVRGENADHRADIFAFGAVLYEMLSGHRAFKKLTSAETMTAILNEEPSSITQSTIGLTPGLQRIVHRCLEKVPEQRFQSASDLAFALEALSDSGSSSTIGAAATSEFSRKKMMWIGAAAGATAIAAALIVWWRLPPAVPVVENITQLTDDGQPKSGGLVTDGSRIYFNEGSLGNLRLMQVVATGGETSAIPTNLENPFIADLSPDGSQLLLGSGGYMTGSHPLWSLPVTAGEPRRLGSIDGSVDWASPAGFLIPSGARGQIYFDYSYAPDGRIVYAAGKYGNDLYTAESDGSNPHKLFTYSQEIWEPSISPDGKQIAFSVVFPGDRTFTLVETDPTGSAFHRITKAGADGPSCCARWTPDGKYLVALGESAQRGDLWAIPMETGLFHRSQPPVRLTDGPMIFGQAAMSHDGKHLFAVGMKQRGEFLRYDQKSRQFLEFLPGISGQDVTFSRDRQWVAYRSYPDSSLWRCRIDGSDRLQLTYPPIGAAGPKISPDGKRVAFGYSGDIYLVSMDAGSPEKLVATNAERTFAGSFHWSPDGKLLEFRTVFRSKTASDPSRHELNILDLSSGKITAVPSSSDMGSVSFIAQDKLAGATRSQNKLVILDVNTGKRTDLVSAKLVNWYPSWDLKSEFYTTAGSDPTVMRVRFSDGKVEPIVSLKDLRRASTPSMDVGPNDSLYFTREVGTQEIYSLTVKWP